MTKEHPGACPSCGAAQPLGAERCELCGTSLRVSGDDEATCPACGHGNPPEARYCNQCGAHLRREGEHLEGEQEPLVPSGGTSSEEQGSKRPDSNVGRRALLIVGAAVVMVVGLYLLSTWLSNRPDSTAGGETGQSEETGAEIPALPDSLQEAADAYAAENTAGGWYEAGRYYLTQSWRTQQTNPDFSVLWARKALTYFERSLEIEADPDVRLAVAEAASLERSDPMRPVQEIQAILAEHPDHIGANLMLGERRVMIGRYDDAIESFEKVLEVAPEGDPRRVTAERFLVETRRRKGGQ